MKFYQQRIACLFLLFIGIILQVGCSNNVGSTASNPVIPPVSVESSPLTIDSAGVIPVFVDNAPTNTTIYIHNNSDYTITNISYTSMVNSDNMHRLVTESSAALCASIKPHQSCPLAISVPALSTGQEQGSGLITATYMLQETNKKEQQYSFSQLLNYARTKNNSLIGAQFSSTSNIGSYNNKNAYATLYLYCNGLSNQVCDIESIQFDKTVRIINGSFNGKKLAVGSIQPVEIQALVTKENYVVTGFISSKYSSLSLDRINTNKTSTIQLTQESKNFNKSISLTVFAKDSLPVLQSGLVPVINSNSKFLPASSLFLVNSGSSNALISSINTTGGIKIDSNNGCGIGSSLSIGGSCIIKFSVSAGSTGIGNMKINYDATDQQIAANVNISVITWHDFNPPTPNINPSLNIQTPDNPLSFNQGIGGSANFTISNNGNVAMKISSITPQLLTGSATFSISQNTCLSGNDGVNLAVGDSCSFILDLNDVNAELAKNILIEVAGEYSGTQQYTTSYTLVYNSNSFAANLFIDTTRSSLSVVGDGIASSNGVLQVVNLGAAPAQINSFSLINSPDYLSVEDIMTKCPMINGSQTCDLNIVLGPKLSSSVLSGSASYSINYDGTEVTSSNIQYEVIPEEQALVTSAVNFPANTSGDGSIADPYQFLGATISPQLTLTLTNAGSASVLIRGVQDTNSSLIWQLDFSDCVNRTLNPGEFCHYNYTNLLATSSAALNPGSSFNSNLIIPTITFQNVASGNLFSMQPPITSILNNPVQLYINANLATITNNVEVIDNGQVTAKVRVTHNLTNSSGYSSVQMTTTMSPYLLTTGATSINGCSASLTGGLLVQNCTLNTDGLYGMEYPVNPDYLQVDNLDLVSLFNLVSNGQIVSANPLAAITHLIKF